MSTLNSIAILSALSVTATPIEDLTEGDTDKTLELFEAVRAGKATVTKNDDGVLTASLSKRSVRAIRRAEKAARQEELKAEVVEQLEAKRPQKIGPVVSALAEKRGLEGDAKQKFRGEVLEAFRALREGDNPIVKAENDTASNFHVRYTLTADPGPFPPEPETSEDNTSDNDSEDSEDSEASA